MHELFTLGFQEQDPNKKKTETAAIFAGTGSEIKIKATPKASKTEANKEKLKTPRGKAKLASITDKPSCSKSSVNSTSNETLSPPLVDSAVIKSPSTEITSNSQSIEPCSQNQSTTSKTESFTTDGTGSASTPLTTDNGGLLSADNNSISTKPDKLKASFLQVLQKFKKSKLEERGKKSKRNKRSSMISFDRLNFRLTRKKDLFFAD